MGRSLGVSMYTTGKHISGLLADLKGTAYARIQEIVQRPEGGSFDEIAAFVQAVLTLEAQVWRIERKLEKMVDTL